MAIKLKLKKGDRVIVTAGKDKGKKGDIIKIFPSLEKALISGINVSRKHTKPTKLNPQGGIVTKEMPVHISNISILDPKTDQPSKIGFKILEGGKKVRFAKRSGEIIDNLK